jgi:hypothetical protein
MLRGHDPSIELEARSATRGQSPRLPRLACVLSLQY